MKRTALLAVFMLLPLSLMAMKPVSDYDLSKVTGQSGVTIAIDAEMNVAFDQVGWGDTDGIPGASAAGGWVGISDLRMNKLHIWPRTDFAMEASDSVPYETSQGGLSDIQLATVDVVTIHDSPSTTITAALIGVPTLTITMESMSCNVVLGPDASYSARDENGHKAISGPNFNQVLGQVYIGGLNMATGKDGTVTIYGHRTGSLSAPYANAPARGTMYGSGITMELNNVKVDYLLMNELAWGDFDGYYDRSASDSSHNTAGMAKPGWVGLKDVAIKNLALNGTMFIDAGTFSNSGNDRIASASDFKGLLNCMDERYVATLGTFNTSFVSIIFSNNFSIAMEEMGAKVQVGSTHHLGETMGDIYVSGMKMTILDNPVCHNQSYAHIFAH